MISKALECIEDKLRILVTYPSYSVMLNDIRSHKDTLRKLQANIYFNNISFPNGSRIIFISNGEDYTRYSGTTFDKVFFHEYGKVDHGLESFVLSRLNGKPEVKYAAV